MNEANKIITTDRITNVVNYSGIHSPYNDYRKFDIVYSTGDARFYYAREDVFDGGGAIINQANRISLIPDGPLTSQGQSHYVLDTANTPDALGAEIKAGQLIKLNGTTGDNDGTYRVIQVNKDMLAINGDPSLTGASIQVLGINDSQIKNFEPADANPISITALTIDVGGDEDLWSRDAFFFDADYGSQVNYKCNNYKYKFGDGYQINQPKNINSVSFEATLKFKNRTNREANAIIHFVENHQGQHERDAPSPNLEYSQGISGFRWDGNATFHPYDSTEIQSKDFYCSEFSHSLNFENSNDISLTLRNLNTSLLRKSETMFVKRAEDYGEDQPYEKNDVVFFADNHQYYYLQSDSVLANTPPVEVVDSPGLGESKYRTINTEHWTREFFWKPSLGLEVSQKPRVKEIALGAGYTQIYQDGINESLLELNLSFNNRSDNEAYAILHFLEQHYGCIPFQFTPPAPYDQKKSFVCEEWQHTYNYKNNHSITAKFNQSAFNFSSEDLTNATRESLSSEGELVMPQLFFALSESDEEIAYNDNYRFRLPVENVGGERINISQVTIQDTDLFYRVGPDNYVSTLIVPLSLQEENYRFTLPEESSLREFAGQEVRLSKTFSTGPLGGTTFSLINNLTAGSFVQSNRGYIYPLSNPADAFFCDYYITEEFIKNNSTEYLDGGANGYIEIVYNGSTLSQKADLLCAIVDAQINLLQSSTSESLLITYAETYQKGKLSINSSSRYSPTISEFQVFTR